MKSIDSKHQGSGVTGWYAVVGGLVWGLLRRARTGQGGICVSICAWGPLCLRAGALVEQPDTSLKKSSTAISREALGPTEDYSGSVSCRYSRWYYSASRL